MDTTLTIINVTRCFSYILITPNIINMCAKFDHNLRGSRPFGLCLVDFV